MSHEDWMEKDKPQEPSSEIIMLAEESAQTEDQFDQGELSHMAKYRKVTSTEEKETCASASFEEKSLSDFQMRQTREELNEEDPFE